MAEMKLQVERRDETGKGSARKVRADGKVPAILYGKGIEPTAIAVDRRALFGAFHTDAGTNVLLDIQLDGKNVLAIAREIQRDPVRGTVLHADFIKVDRTQQIEVEVPIHLVGESPGVKEGGVLEQPLFTVDVRCRVTDVPENIEADISHLVIGDSLRVAELSVAEGEILTNAEAVVVAVAAPISEEQLEAMVAEAAAPAEEEEAVPTEEEEAAPEEGAEAEAGAEPEAAEGEGEPGQEEAKPEGE
jgi:large subunit ribosomal protein L25